MNHFYALSDEEIYTLTIGEFNRKLAELDFIVELEINIVANAIGKSFGGEPSKGGSKKEITGEDIKDECKKFGISSPK